MLDVAIEAFLLSLIGAAPDPQTITDAQAIIRGYFDDDNTSTSWKGLDKKTDWCPRAEELLGDPKKINQGGTKYCMAAACLFVLFKRAPEVMAKFCVDLASTGKGKINKLEITMTKDIQNFDVRAYAITKSVNVVDFILLLAIQNAMSSGFFSKIETPDSGAASPSTDASDIVKVLKASQLFLTPKVLDNPKVSDLKDAKTDTDIILVGDASFFTTSARFQRHAVVCVPPMTADNANVSFHFWSWGMVQTEMVPGLTVLGGYYSQTASIGEFEIRIHTAIILTAK